MVAEGIQDGISSEIFESFQKMKEKDYSGAEKLLLDGLKRVEETNDSTQQALFYSTLGVLERLRGNYREAWRYYEKAEKFLPDDPSLKIITAKLLMEQFAQYDTAIKKLKSVLKLARGSGLFEHNAHALMAIAFLRKGDRKKAAHMLELSMAEDFCHVPSAENLNFEVLEAFLSRHFEVDLCRRYVEKGLELARHRHEERPVRFLTKLLEGFEVTVQ